MKHLWIAAAVGGLVLLPVAGWGKGAAEPATPSATPGSVPCPFTSEVLFKPTLPVLSVMLSNPPSTRTRVILEADGHHHELEWDPAVDPRLTQNVILESAPAGWTVSVVVEPIVLKQGTVTTVLYVGQFTRIPDTSVLRASYIGANSSDFQPAQPAGAAGSGSAGKVVAQSLLNWPQPTLTFSCHKLPTIDETPYATSAASGSAVRGFGTIPDPVAQTLSLLGEIAIKRAKTGAMEIVKSRFVVPLCGDDGDGGVTLSRLGLSGGTLALPHTCALLEQLRLEDVLATGKPLLRALRDDVRLTIAPAALRRIAGGTAWGKVAGAALDIVNRSLERGSFSVLDAEAALDLFLNETDFIAMLPLIEPGKRAHLEATIALALGKSCSKVKELKELKDGECARFLVATNDLDSLVNRLPTAAQAAASDLAKALGPLDTFAKAMQAKLVSLHPVLSHFPACNFSASITAPQCASAIARSWNTASDVLRTLDDLGYDAASSASIAKQLQTMILARVDPKVPDAEVTRVVQLACTARLAVGILRRCSGQGCSNAAIHDMFTAPKSYFSHSEPLCWGEGDAYRIASASLPNFEAFVADGLELLAAAAKQSASARVAGVLRMFVRLTNDIAGCTGEAALTSKCHELESVNDLVAAVAEEDHAKAIAATTALVRTLLSHVPPALTKGTQLLGIVAAYAQVYEDTKSQDASAARQAREKALEGLIDAATDRHGRGDTWIVSLGSNVGIGVVWSSPKADGYNNSKSLQLRVPIGFDLDKLPPETHSVGIGWHVGATIGDLGQFAAVGSDGKVDAVRWDNFLSPGVEGGILIGVPEHALNVAVHLEYAPALFATATGGGAWRAGISLGYYVPFFDFN
jgi:hypothetical protein